MVNHPPGQLALPTTLDDTLLDDIAATFVGRLNAIADKTKPARPAPAPKPKPAPNAVQPPLVRSVPTPPLPVSDTAARRPKPETVPADQLAKLHEAKEATLARLELIYRQIAHLEAQTRRAG